MSLLTVRHCSTLRAWVAAALAAGVLWSGLELHAHAGLVTSTLTPGGGEYFPEATHPEQAPHLEHGHAATRPECPACLRQLQSQSGPAAAGPQFALLHPAGALQIASAPPASGIEASSPATRGPPSFS